jgi:hypothetical protein
VPDGFVRGLFALAAFRICAFNSNNSNSRTLRPCAERGPIRLGRWTAEGGCPYINSCAWTARLSLQKFCLASLGGDVVVGGGVRKDLHAVLERTIKGVGKGDGEILGEEIDI